MGEQSGFNRWGKGTYLMVARSEYQSQTVSYGAFLNGMDMATGKGRRRLDFALSAGGTVGYFLFFFV